MEGLQVVFLRSLYHVTSLVDIRSMQIDADLIVISIRLYTALHQLRCSADSRQPASTKGFPHMSSSDGAKPTARDAM